MNFYGDEMLTLTFHFDCVEAAAAFLAAQGERTPQAQPDAQPTIAERTETTDVTTPEPVKKARKPRADAGVPRGPYKKDETPEPAATEKTPAEGDKPQPSGVVSAPAAAEPVKEWTIDAIKAEMSVLSKKKGIDANIQLLAKFGVQKVSALPATKYNEFVAAVRAAAAA
jgi:hypothetical protein